MKIVYRIRNVVNGKSYIGSSISFPERKKQHLYLLRRGKSGSYALQNAWVKYGESSFVWEILEQVSDSDDLIMKEEEWIIKLDSIKHGYNIKLPYTQQKLKNTQYKLSFSAKQWILDNGPASLRHISKEEWISKKKQDPSFRMPRRQYTKRGDMVPKKKVVGVDKSGTVVLSFPSKFKAYKHLTSKPRDNGLDRCLKDNSLYVKFRVRAGLYWFYEDNWDKDRFLSVINIPKPIKVRVARSIKKNLEDIIPYADRNIRRTSICLYNIDTKETKSFVSVMDAAKFLNVAASKVSSLKRGYRNKGKGEVVKINKIKNWEIRK